MPSTAASGVVAIGWLQLAFASGFIVVSGAVSLALGLGVTRDLWVASLRTYAQLLALGFVLRWVFRNDTPLVVLAILVVMLVAATSIILRRSPDAPAGLFGSTLLAMALTGVTITFAVTGLVVGVQPWWHAQYVIPIGGMVIGNSMSGIALALERVFADLDARHAEVLSLAALGATPWEAARPSVRTALRAGMIPGINTLAAVGIVFIPGMMAGQILAGTDPLVAAPYQIVVMLMVATADILGSVAAVLLSYPRRFSAEGVYLERGRR
ncbi:MAG TPA: iron export ABC transporter permease subunit FetB [Coriobacteriia bacterium]